MTLIATILGLSLILMAGVFLFYIWSHRQSQNKEDAVAFLQQQIESVRAQMGEAMDRQSKQVQDQFHQISQNLLTSQKTIGDRLDNAARVVGHVQKGLGQLGEASERIFEVGKDINQLQNILRAPKMRGGLGEYFLGDLLRQIIPAAHFSLQHKFKTGQAVDAVIKLGGRLVPVDSKFPLENFRKWSEKTHEEGLSYRKKYAQDVKKHVNAIAEKYILPDEGTFDFALMYIPAENVYYECLVKPEAAGDENPLYAYALQKRVIPVSPSSFYGYLQTILLGLKGMDIEENARHIMQNLSRLQGDMKRFSEDFDMVGKHLTNARMRYEDAGRRLTRFQEKLEGVSEEEITTTKTTSQTEKKQDSPSMIVH